MNTARRRMMGQSLPYAYRVAFLESTNGGQQYIDTGIKANEKTSVRVRFQRLDTTTTGLSVFGARVNYRKSLVIWTNGASGMGVSAHYSYNPNNPAEDSGLVYAGDITNDFVTVEVTPALIKVNNSVVFYWANTNRQPWQSDVNSFLFCKQDPRGYTYFVGRISEAEIWQDGVQLRNFIAVKDKNLVPCFYDEVTKNFFYNRGNSPFIAGNQI